MVTNSQDALAWSGQCGFAEVTTKRLFYATVPVFNFPWIRARGRSSRPPKISPPVDSWIGATAPENSTYGTLSIRLPAHLATLIRKSVDDWYCFSHWARLPPSPEKRFLLPESHSRLKPTVYHNLSTERVHANLSCGPQRAATVVPARWRSPLFGDGGTTSGKAFLGSPLANQLNCTTSTHFFPIGESPQPIPITSPLLLHRWGQRLSNPSALSPSATTCRTGEDGELPPPDGWRVLGAAGHLRSMMLGVIVTAIDPERIAHRGHGSRHVQICLKRGPRWACGGSWTPRWASEGLPGGFQCCSVRLARWTMSF